MPAVESPWYPLDDYMPRPVLKAVLDDFEQRFGRRPDATVHYDTGDGCGDGPLNSFRFRVTAPDDTDAAVQP